MLQLRSYHPAQTAPKPSIAAGPPSVRRADPPSVASSLPAGRGRVGKEKGEQGQALSSLSHPPGAFVALHAQIKGAARQSKCILRIQHASEVLCLPPFALHFPTLLPFQAFRLETILTVFPPCLNVVIGRRPRISVDGDQVSWW